MRKEHYYTMLRLISGLGAIGLWAMSVYFNYVGFSIEVPSMAWAGWFLAIIITVIELVWSKRGISGNITIFAVGVCAYAYGIWTNYIGITSIGVAGSGATSAIGRIVLAVFLEVVPEPLLVWSLVGETAEDDMLGYIGKMLHGFFGEPSKSPTPQNTWMRNLPNANQGKLTPIKNGQSSHFNNLPENVRAAILSQTQGGRTSGDNRPFRHKR